MKEKSENWLEESIKESISDWKLKLQEPLQLPDDVPPMVEEPMKDVKDSA
jgi:hypothetical protein